MPTPIQDDVTRTRMTEETRRTFETILNGKLTIFENYIMRGVNSLLNTHYERQELDAQHSVISSLFSKKNKRRKEKFQSVTTVAKQATSNAPMGIGSAANVTLSVANSAAGAILDRAEEKRQEDEAQQRLDAAKYQLYIPTPENYTTIARRVARELSYMLQLVILRLAPGDEGYIKLAKFLIESMQKYALKRFPEYHGGTDIIDQVVAALIDASIAPPSDAVRYRDWPHIDFANYSFSFQMGRHTPLELDTHVNDLLKLVGPAVTTLLGASIDTSFTNPNTMKEQARHDFTIVGVLNHSCSVNPEDGEIFAGIESASRPEETLSGNFKYPLLMIKPGSSPGKGMNYAPRSTGKYLEKAQKIALSRIAQEYEYSASIIKTRYPGERHEVPWNPHREANLRERLKSILNARRSATDDESIVTTPHYSELQAMRAAGSSFDLNLAREDAHLADSEADAVRVSVYQEADAVEREKMRLEAAISAKYLATSARNYTRYIMQCSTYSEEDLNLATGFIESSRTTLNASRGFPLNEASKFRTVRQAVNRATLAADLAIQIQFKHQKNIQELLTVIEGASLFSKSYENEQHNIARHRKKIFLQIASTRENLRKLTDVTQIIALNARQQEETGILGEKQAIEEFKAVAVKTRAAIEEVPQHGILYKGPDIIARYLAEAEVLHAEICAAFKVHDLHIVEEGSPSVEESQVPESAKQKKDRLKLTSKNNIEAIRHILSEVRDLISSRSFINGRTVKQTVRGKINAARGHLAACQAILMSMQLEFEENPSELDQETQAFLNRSGAYNALGKLLFLASKVDGNEHLPSLTAELKEKIGTLYLASRGGRANFATLTYAEAIEEEIDMTAETPIEVASSYSRTIRKNKNKIELAISGDIEYKWLAYRQAQFACKEIETVVKNLQECYSRLSEYIDEYYKELARYEDTTTLESSDLSDVPNQLRKLRLHFAPPEEQSPTTQDAPLATARHTADDHERHIDIASQDNVSFTTDSSEGTGVKNLQQQKQAYIESIQHALLNIIEYSCLDAHVTPEQKHEATATHSSSLQMAVGQFDEKQEEEEDEEKQQLEGASLDRTPFVHRDLEESTASTSTGQLSSISIESTDLVIHRQATEEKIVRIIDELIAAPTENWGELLVIKLVQWLTEQMLEKQSGALARERDAESQLRIIQQISATEPPELAAARRAAVQKVKQAYQDILSAKREQVKLTNGICSHKISPNIVVVNTLEWASALNYPEQRWLDEERNSKNLAITSMQKEFRVTAVTVDPQLIVSLSFRLRALEKERRLFNSQATQIVRLKRLAFHLHPSVMTREVEQGMSWINAVIREKLSTTNDSIAKLDKCRKSFTRQVLSVYFAYWKVEVDDTEASNVQVQVEEEAKTDDPPQRQVTETKSKKTKSKVAEPSTREIKVKMAAQNYSADDVQRLISEISTSIEVNEQRATSRQSNPEALSSGSDELPCSPTKTLNRKTSWSKFGSGVFSQETPRPPTSSARRQGRAFLSGSPEEPVSSSSSAPMIRVLTTTMK